MANPFTDFSNWWTDVVDSFFGNPSTAWDRFKNGKTNETNKEVAEENLAHEQERNKIEDARYTEETAYNRSFANEEQAYQRAFAENERAYQRAFAEEARDYQRSLQQQIFEREDTALERQASALSSMGINPLSQQLNGLGSGAIVSSTPAPSLSAGSASPGSMSSRGGSALHNDFQMQDSGLAGLLGSLMEVTNSIDNLNTNGLQRDSLREQINHQKLINESQSVENEYQKLKLESEIKNLNANTKSTESNTKREEELHPSKLLNSTATAERNQRENKFQSDWGVTDNSTNYARTGADAAAAIATSTEKQKELVDKSPLNITAKTLRNSASIVGNAFADTFGAGAKKIIDFVNRNKNKNKYRSAQSGRMW